MNRPDIKEYIIDDFKISPQYLKLLEKYCDEVEDKLNKIEDASSTILPEKPNLMEYEMSRKTQSEYKRDLCEYYNKIELILFKLISENKV